MNTKLRSWVVATLVYLLFGALPATRGAEDPYIPQALAPWVDWVLQDRDLRACPLASDGTGARLCAWPGLLALELDDAGGRFEQTWTLYAEDWVPLPGGGGHWPERVRAGERAVAVVEHQGGPAVRLEPGTHRLTGRFGWPRRPEVLPVPAETGLLALHLDGAVVPEPRLDGRGRLWLGRGAREQPAAEPDTLSVDVVRRIEDEVPLRVLTRITLDVSGQTREIALGPVLLAGGAPLSVDSPLPARLDRTEDERGLLRIQLRPGRWTLTVESHHPGPVEALTLEQRPPPWPAEEVWVFAAHNDLRQVEPGGAPAVDPRQARLPDEWRDLPAYLLQPDATLRLDPLRRGASGSDRLRLDRDLWLDYGGAAFSLRDRLTGRLEERWRLETEPVLELGQVRVGGEPRFITRLAGGDALGRAGVEVRQGQLELTADARILSGPVSWGIGLPASGWALPLDGITTRLHLPPGWDLLAVDGVDNLPRTWLARWSLLDLFLVLIAALAVGRLWGWPWGLLGLVTLALIWQEPGAPRWVWLHVLAGAALLRVLPADPGSGALRHLRAALRLYYRGALLLLALIAVPFLITEVRDGLFPQLDRPATGRPGVAAHWPIPAPMAPAPSARVEGMLPSPSFDEETVIVTGEAGRRAKLGTAAGRPESKPLPTIDPDARLQTGAGVPDWSWRSFHLEWSGPVPTDHRARLWLLPPAAALALAAAKLALVLLLGLRLADWLPSRARPGGAPPGAGGVPVLAGLLTVAALMMPAGEVWARTAEPEAVVSPSQPAPAAAPARPLGTVPATGFPPTELLRALEQRLLEPPVCLPRCAEIPRLWLQASADELRLRLDVDAAVPVALPVPGSKEGWRATRVTIDGTPFDGLRQLDGTLVAPVPAGRHQLLLDGPLPPRDQVEIPLPLRPRSLQAEPGPWQLDGVDADGRPAEQLRLLRLEPAAATAGPEPAALPPLLLVTRTLRFGLDWTVATEVRRLSPADQPVTVRVPLIPGEAVTTPGMQVDDGRILVALPPGRGGASWASSLQPVQQITLTATEDARLTEAWRLEVSPLWHLSYTGIPPVQNTGPADRWLPTWRPWPGESLELRLERPEGVPGPSLTLDRSHYRVAPGRRGTDASLELDLRSSQGGRHRVVLPAGAELTGLNVDGEARPLALQGRTLELPLVPGRQQITVDWREPAGLRNLYRPASLNLGTPGVNADTEVQLPRDRWVLWTAGPGIGPAVLFWGLLVVLALFAGALARSHLTPLRFTDWLLLGIGLSQAGVWVGALVVLWLFALGLRRRLDPSTPRWRFNLTQLGLALLSVVALAALLVAVQQGLLGSPEMQIAGNGSSASNLNWYLDRQDPETRPVTVVSAPIWVYRALMLAWALWLAWRLLGWLRWGWHGYAEPTPWRGSPRPRPGKRDGKSEALSVDI